jgi:glycosyltransferase involved in cell wall biosynthesis
MKPRLLMVGRTRYRLPLAPSLAEKFDALAAELDVHVLAADGGGAGTDPRFHLVRRTPALDGPSYYALLPLRVARAIRELRPDAVLAQGAQEAALAEAGAAIARIPTPVIADIHGDPGAPTRLYGSRSRKALAPLADALAGLGLRHAAGVRTISPYTSGLVRDAGVEPVAEFAAFMDLEPFLVSDPVSLPERPVALFVGVLERYKAVDVLAEAWRDASRRVPDGVLRLVGDGTLRGVARSLVDDLPQQTAWNERLDVAQVASALDDATVLVLPSRSEGLGRVVVEAFCRGRGVVASRVGGIVDIVADGETGILVSPEDPGALAEALVRVLSEPALATRLGRNARVAVEPWLATPQEYATRVRELVERVVRERAHEQRT